MQLEQYLQSIGLNNKEAKLYIAGLQLGPASIQNLAKASNIKRSTVYEVIESLQEKNLISVTPKNKRKLFSMQEPENLILFLKQKENILEQILPDLEAIKNTEAKKPAIRYFEGIEGLKQIYEDMIKKPGEIFAMTAPRHKISKTIFDYLANDWNKRRVKNDIFIKRIDNVISSTKLLTGKKISRKNDLEEIFYFPDENYPFSVGIYVYRQKVAFISYQDQEMVGIIIRSSEINKTVKSCFDLFWNKDFISEISGSQRTAAELANVMEGIIERDNKDSLINEKNIEDLTALGMQIRQPKREIIVDSGKISGVSKVVDAVMSELKQSEKIISLEGLSGTGKSSTADFLAERLDAAKFSLGEIFRILAFNYQKGEKDFNGILSKLSYVWVGEKIKILENNEDVYGNYVKELRSEELEKVIPIISSMCQKQVIEFAGKEISSLANQGTKKIIIEGRKFTLDFMPSDVRIKLHAGLAVRAFRRWQEGYW